MMLEHSPNTAMILGAALSGGDAMGLARRIADALGTDDEGSDGPDQVIDDGAGPTA